MTDLLYPGGNNIAGLFQIRYAPVIGLLSLPIPAPGGQWTVGAPTFQPGFAWKTIYGTEGSKEYDEDGQDSDNGTVWNLQLRLFLPGDSDQQRATLNTMTLHRFVVECQDNLGIWRRLGTIEQSLKLTYKFGIDAAPGGKRGATLTFAGSMTQPPAIVS